MLLRPVMGVALVSSRLIHKVDDGLATNAHDGSSDDHVGCDALSHGVWCKCHGIVAMTGQGFAPCLPLRRISR